MKTVFPRAFRHAVEPLESRIAPASLSFVDVDGDNATITINKGSDADLTAAAHFLEVTPGHFQLQELAIGGVDDFRGANVSIEATANGGDGFVNVGYLNATGADLGRVTLDGDLGRIDVGDSVLSTPGIDLLEVKSIGALHLTTQAPGGTWLSNIKGAAGAVVVHGDIREAQLEISGNLGGCTIDGSLIGGTDEKTGSIRATGMIKHVTVNGTVQGGAGLDSGRISAGSKLLDVTIGSGIIGGGGDNSGQLAARDQLADITVNGGIVGGAGVESGGLATAGAASKVTINGDVKGGAGMQSGELASSGNITDATINGSLLGGSGVQSGSIGTDKGISSVHITGDIIGGTGPSSGQIVTRAIIHGLKVDGSLIGGAERESGAIGSLNGIDDIVIGKNIVAGTGERSGLIVCDVLPTGSIGSVKVLGSIQGTPSVGLAGASSGGILSGHDIGFVEVGADILGGNSLLAGSIRAQDELVKVILHGSLIGGSGERSGAVASNHAIGNVEIGKDIVGGMGVRSGEVSAGSDASVETAISRSAAAAAPRGDIARVSVAGSIRGYTGQAGGGALDGRIFSTGDLGTVLVTGDIVGGIQPGSGAVVADGSIKTITITGGVAGGDGDESGTISGGTELRRVQIDKDLAGGAGVNAGAVISRGDIRRVNIGGSVVGGAGDFSGRIATVNLDKGDIGTITIVNELAGGDGMHSGEISSSFALNRVTLDALTGGSELFSGAILSGADMGTVKVTEDVTGSDGDESGKIYSGGKIKSITIGGELVGGDGDYDTATLEDDAPEDTPIGQIVSVGAMGSVKIGTDITGADGIGSANVQGASIASVFVGGSVVGGDGDDSGAIIATRTDLGVVKITDELAAGSGERSGHIGANRNIGTIEVTDLTGFNDVGFMNPALITAGGKIAPESAGQAVAIKKLVVSDATSFADILAGYDIAADSLNPDAQIGTVIVGVRDGDGTWESTNLVAGAESGIDLRFGTSDDTVISSPDDVGGITSRIDRVVISGEINLSVGQLATRYGIVAEQVATVILGGATVALSGGAGNDFLQLGGTGGDTAIFEPHPS